MTPVIVSDLPPLELAPGTVLVLPSNVPHAGKAITDVKVIDVFHPVREDFIGAAFAGYGAKKN